MSICSIFLINSAMLGTGLAMDAFTVSIADGLHEPHMNRQKRVAIAATFAFFQWFMPMFGFFCVRYMMELFQRIRPHIPLVSLILLLFIGGEMFLAGIQSEQCCDAGILELGIKTLLLQGLATSIDALAVGFTISSLSPIRACSCALIIAGITFFLSILGLFAGRKLGCMFCGKAKLLGGSVLILIGIRIFLSGI